MVSALPAAGGLVEAALAVSAGIALAAFRTAKRVAFGRAGTRAVGRVPDGNPQGRTPPSWTPRERGRGQPG